MGPGQRGSVSWASSGAQKTWLLVWFPVRAHAWHVGSIPHRKYAGGSQWMLRSGINVSLSLPFLFFSLKINKKYLQKEGVGRRTRKSFQLNSFKEKAVSILIWEHKMLFIRTLSGPLSLNGLLGQQRAISAESIIHFPPASPPPPHTHCTATPILSSDLSACWAETKPF